MEEFKITKEQILQMSKYDELVEYDLKQWFPEAFETKLEVGRWYKINNIKTLLFVLSVSDKDFEWFGFNYKGEWLYNYTSDIKSSKKLKPATDSEVEAALINEAKKRGFKSNMYIEADWNGWCKVDEEQPYLDSNNHLWMGGSRIFVDGSFAKIIPTMTKQEAEEKLGVKICD